MITSLAAVVGGPVGLALDAVLLHVLAGLDEAGGLLEEEGHPRDDRIRHLHLQLNLSEEGDVHGAVGEGLAEESGQDHLGAHCLPLGQTTGLGVVIRRHSHLSHSAGRNHVCVECLDEVPWLEHHYALEHHPHHVRVVVELTQTRTLAELVVGGLLGVPVAQEVQEVPGRELAAEVDGAADHGRQAVVELPTLHAGALDRAAVDPAVHALGMPQELSYSRLFLCCECVPDPPEHRLSGQEVGPVGEAEEGLLGRHDNGAAGGCCGGLGGHIGVVSRVCGGCGGCG
mmetsp:Transcript_51110/g.128273  ORF Transcript_51110/g.128273 Transcript_51110/m.128273 type:complete len:285 (+) Transcript_51110:1255-2109(+)